MDVTCILGVSFKIEVITSRSALIHAIVFFWHYAHFKQLLSRIKCRKSKISLKISEKRLESSLQPVWHAGSCLALAKMHS